MCQPCIAAFAATAILSEDRSEALPRSLVLMSGPIDPGANETEVTSFALKHDLEWFEQPAHLHRPQALSRAGTGGSIRVWSSSAGFMSTQLSRHLSQHMDLFMGGARMRAEDAQKITEFYDEYLAVQDLTADFYLDTLHRVFQRRDIPNGQFDWHGRVVDFGAIQKVKLVTIEGEKDDICGPGQTAAPTRSAGTCRIGSRCGISSRESAISARSAAPNTAPASFHSSSGLSPSHAASQPPASSRSRPRLHRGAAGARSHARTR